jgi:hypothetical protein
VSASEWGIVIGMATSAILALGPWMFMVHAKLAVIANQIAELDEKVEHAAAANEELWALCAEHHARLEAHDVELAHFAD